MRWVIVLLSVLLVITAIYALRVRRKADQYTRERYAFAALLATTNLVALALTTAYGKTPWGAIGKIWAQFNGRPVPQQEQPLDWAQQILIFLFIGFVIYIINRTFITWTGSFSAQDRRRLELHEERYWLAEGLSELAHIVRWAPERPRYVEHKEGTGRLIQPPPEVLTWRDNARELVELRWQSHSFPQSAWHEAASVWIGKNNKTEAATGLLCVRTDPGLVQLAEFIEYCGSLPALKGLNLELISAVQEGRICEQRQVRGLEITVVSEMALLESLVDFTDYCRQIERRATVDTLSDSDFNVADIYVPVNIVPSPTATRQIDTTQSVELQGFLTEWLHETGQRHIALLGEYGQGKSTAALMFAYGLIRDLRTKGGRIPILVELRGMSPSTLQPLQLLGAWCSPYGIEPRSLMKLITSGRIVMIFDAFDEMAGAGDPEARRDHFRSLWRFAYSRNKIVITGRPNFFLDEHELKAALGVEKASGVGAYCEAHYLSFFNLDQIEQTLKKMKQTGLNEIIYLADRDQKFFDLIARPSLLYIVGLLWTSEKLSERTNLKSTEVIELFLRASYRRQSKKNEDGRDFMDLSSAEREYFMDGIAAYMMARRLNNQILVEQFRDAITKLLDMIPVNVNSMLSALDGIGPVKPLTDRLRGRVNPIVDIETDVRTYGILAPDYSKPGALRFAHKSFFEFLVARLVARRILGKEKENTAAVLLATEANPRSITDLPESLVFLGELVEESSHAGGARITDDRQALMQSLFNAIILRNRVRLPAFCAWLILAELRPLWGRQGFVFGLVDIAKRPSYWLAFLLVCVLELSYGVPRVVFPPIVGAPEAFSATLADPAVRLVLAVETAVLGGMGTVLGIRALANATHISRDVELWFRVIASMGWSRNDIKAVYGRLAASLLLLPKLDDRP